jgi:hypothetical protein
MKHMLELNIKDSYIEYVVDQWIHCLYLPPIPEVPIQVDEMLVKTNLDLLLANKLQTPSLVQKFIPHYLNSWEYFPLFAKQLLLCTKQEMESKSKKTDELKATFYQGKEMNEWKTCSTAEEAISLMIDSRGHSNAKKRTCFQRRQMSRASFGRPSLLRYRRMERERRQWEEHKCLETFNRTRQKWLFA